jgi:hypothetical protein
VLIDNRAMVPAQHFIGYLQVLAVCLKSSQSFPFTCGWKRRANSALEKFPENTQMSVTEEVFTSYFHMLFKQYPIMFDIFTARVLKDYVFSPMTLLGKDIERRFEGKKCENELDLNNRTKCCSNMTLHRREICSSESLYVSVSL